MIEKHRLETTVSVVLIIGVLASLFLEVLGLFLYYVQFGRFEDLLATGWQMQGRNFFAYVVTLVLSFRTALDPTKVVALGVVILVLTPYVSVVGSVIYFGSTKNFKYLWITIFVLSVLTLSLALH